MTWCCENFIFCNEFQRSCNFQNVAECGRIWPNVAESSRIQPQRTGPKNLLQKLLQGALTNLNPHTPLGTVLKRTVRADFWKISWIICWTILRLLLGPFWGPFWYQIGPRRGQYGIKRAIKSFKDPTSFISKNLKKL